MADETVPARQRWNHVRQQAKTVLGFVITAYISVRAILGAATAILIVLWCVAYLWDSTEPTTPVSPGGPSFPVLIKPHVPSLTTVTSPPAFPR
ncbi:hypothetical protein [Nocardia crassostreae]|uniref:hypothetical protein n=1 Tax=Nocardia crassostreae TaxID=53428 RepID=UPI00082F0848|nr:hypothetical protein [Nocardia crassostreae]